MSQEIQLRTYRFHPNRLDPISIYIEQYGLSSSRMTVQCYSRAWTAYWGSHGEAGVESFVCGCHPEYVADNLTWGLNGLIGKRQEKHDYHYLVRIVEAIQDHFRKLRDLVESEGGEA